MVSVSSVHLFEMDGGEMLVAQVVAGVLAVERIDRVGAQVGLFGGFGHRGLDLLAQLARAPALGVAHEEDRRAGILADGGGIAPGHLDVFQDGFQRVVGRRAGFFLGQGLAQHFFHIRRQVGRCKSHQFKNFLGQIPHAFLL